MQQYKNNILLDKIHAFIRRFYFNRMIKGAIYFFINAFSLFVVFIVGEYFIYFSSDLRMFILLFYFALNIFLLVRFVIFPLTQIYRITKTISITESAVLIGKFFPDIKDKLLNTIQLQNLSYTHESELLQKAVEQRTQELKPLDFRRAVNIRLNLKYLPYLVLPVTIIVFILFAAPNMISEPVFRYYNYTSEFAKPLPYSVILINESLQVIQGEDITINASIDGKSIPDKLYIEYDGITVMMKEMNKLNYSYTFKNLQKDFKFKFKSEEYHFENHYVQVIPNPSILNLTLSLNYPDYTNKKNEKFTNISSIQVPEGTRIDFILNTKNSEQLQVISSENIIHKLIENTRAQFSKFFKNSQRLIFLPENKKIVSKDSLALEITVLKDEFPSISVEQYRDSLNPKECFFMGSISDDYGFSALVFNLEFISDSTAATNQNDPIKIPIDLSRFPQSFQFQFSLNRYNLNPDDQVVYYFTVSDNDAINGHKSTSSNRFSYREPNLKEQTEQRNQLSETTEQSFEAAQQEAKKLAESVNEMLEQLSTKQKLNWEEKEKIQNLIQQSEELKNQIYELNKLNEMKNNYNENILSEEEFKQNEELINKQKQLEELMDKLLNDEIKKQIDQLNELLEKFNQQNKNSTSFDDLKMNAQDIEEKITQQLELFKRFELEQKLSNTINNLNKLEKSQEQLEIQTEKELESNEKLQNNQKNINEDFKEVEKELKDIESKNTELEKPFEMDETEQNQNEINEQLDNAMQNLQQNNKNKASQSQKNAAAEMKKLSSKLSQMMNSMNQESLGEDIQEMRNLLESTVKVSFEQEEIINKLKQTNKNNPEYVEIMKEQFTLKEKIEQIQDSLNAISKRQLAVAPVINKEIDLINNYLNKTIHFAEDRNTSAAQMSQQYVMTSLNNLALLIDESIRNMEEQMNGMQQGTGKSNKNSKPSSSPSLGEMQKQLNQKIQQLQNGMNNSDQGKRDQQGQSISEQLARLAAEQSAIRKQLQRMIDQAGKEGNLNLSKSLKQVSDDMERTEKDLVNKIISQQTLNRQKQIETRLLESQKSQQEQDKENKRESKETIFEKNRNQIEFLEYKRIMEKSDLELLKTMNPEVHGYYKTKIKNYFYNIKDNEND